ncbi:LysE family translocator [Xenophilus sp. Marseille-Q4582]|uniref:LysE family translocator n=1 Tax=Xenophilus sp. Marseille-Q4582 TaxID=2866600 RepID=UPI001CE3BD54|nr:LysE family translocator [Xenophilus sp. Marseille-Q4582]
MIAWTTLGLFLLAALALLASPGPNMAFVLAQGATHGPRSAWAGAVGIALADFVLALAAASGVAALVAAWAPAFDLLRAAGAAYLVWLGVQALRAGAASAQAPGAASTGAWRIARMGFFQTLTNPKALLFFIVFLPQFVQPAQGSVSAQMVQLGAVMALLSLAFNTTLGSAAAWVAQRVAGRSRGRRLCQQLLAGVMFSLALRLLATARPAVP